MKIQYWVIYHAMWYVFYLSVRKSVRFQLFEIREKNWTYVIVLKSSKRKTDNKSIESAWIDFVTRYVPANMNRWREQKTRAKNPIEDATLLSKGTFW